MLDILSNWIKTVFAQHAIIWAFILWLSASVLFITAIAGTFPGQQIPGLAQLYDFVGTKNPAEDIHNLFWLVSFWLGALAAMIALINAMRRTGLMQSEQDNQTFAEAVKLLGDKNRSVRLGAIYALEGLMKLDFNSPGRDGALGRQIGDTLAAYVREQSIAPHNVETPRTDKPISRFQDRSYTFASKPQVLDKTGSSNQPRLAVDLEAAVQVLARSWPYNKRPDLRRENGVDLSYSRLDYLCLPAGADVRRFNFSDAILKHINVSRVNLQGARLEGADLQEANLRGAKLQKADLLDANLEGVWLDSAKLQEANLVGANLQKADLERAKLQEANLVGANLQKADLERANLQEAMLVGANLQAANLARADLQAANLRDACISKAEFNTDIFGDYNPAKNLTSDQVSYARWEQDKPPTLPKGMGLPHRGDGNPVDDPSEFDLTWLDELKELWDRE